MAVGKRLRSRDEHLMLIIPMSSVTERRGDVCCLMVKWTWTSCFGPCLTAQKWMSPTRWAFRPRPEQEPPKSTCLGTRMMTLVGRSSGGVDEVFAWESVSLFEVCRGGDRLLEGGVDEVFAWESVSLFEVCRGDTIYEQMDVTWMDKPLRLPLPRPLDQSNDPDASGAPLLRAVQRSPADDWKACIPNTNRRICSKFQWGSFPMYQIAFEQMGYRLPFSDFEVAVFRYLHLTPSQLHPNSLAFIRAFEMTASYLGFLPTIPLFFHAFHLQRSRPKGDAANKFGWVSLKQSTKLFEMFLESVRGFKDSYFFIKPLNSVSWQSIIYRGPAKDATGAPLMGPYGRPILEDYSRFPLSWRKSHYLKPASDFIYSAEELTVEELSNYEQMKVFVGSFPRKTYEDEDGNMVLDASGVPLTKKCFIDTRRLLACKSSAEMEACFREMSSIAAKLRKSKAAKEKRQAAVLGSSSTTA
ncbi:hypothetical protein TSUD_417390, partial [Trifolium subterraneum]